MNKKLGFLCSFASQNERVLFLKARQPTPSKKSTELTFHHFSIIGKINSFFGTKKGTGLSFQSKSNPVRNNKSEVSRSLFVLEKVKSLFVCLRKQSFGGERAEKQVYTVFQTSDKVNENYRETKFILKNSYWSLSHLTFHIKSKNLPFELQIQTLAYLECLDLLGNIRLPLTKSSLKNTSQ